MKQTRLMSFLESTISTVVGFGVSFAAQVVFLPLLGVAVTLTQNVAFALIMTAISIGRGFLLRRLFEALHIRHPISPFMLAVLAEMRRQREVEGWSIEHDDAHEPGELGMAGAAYAFIEGCGFIRLHRRKFKIAGSKDWVGNWCWNSYTMERTEAKRFILMLRASAHWRCTCGPTRWYDWFNQPIDEAELRRDAAEQKAAKASDPDLFTVKP
jgi:hypothetical protein